MRFETAAGDYIKFERYDDGVSANWSTMDGPQVLLSIPIKGDRPVGQFWTTEDESKECPLPKLASDLRENQSDIIRAWVETDYELIVWRLAGAGATTTAQLGVQLGNGIRNESSNWSVPRRRCLCKTRSENDWRMRTYG